MSPKRASRSSGSGMMSIPMARASVNRAPTIVSGDNLVTFSMWDIATADAKRKAKAPKNGLNPNRIPMARPGRATCERASPTKAIFLITIRDPK